MNLYSILIIYTQLMTNFKVTQGSILIGYYKSHGVRIMVIYGVYNRKIIWVAIIELSRLILIKIE